MLVMKSVESELRPSVMVVEDRPSWPGGCPPGLCTVTSLCPTSVSPRNTHTAHQPLLSLSTLDPGPPGRGHDEAEELLGEEMRSVVWLIVAW